MADSALTRTDALSRLARALAQVSVYCDRVEHAEFADIEWIKSSAGELRSVAISLAHDEDVSLLELYAARLEVVETRYVLGIVDGFVASSELRLAETWRDLQLIQARHDRLYRPDVDGLSRYEQLRHCVIHLGKLVGALADRDTNPPDFLARRVPDILIFGIKLSTVAGDVLPCEAFEGVR